VFLPPDKLLSPPTTDEEEVWAIWLGQRCMPAVAVAMLRGPALARWEAPASVPVLTDECDRKEVVAIDFGCAAASGRCAHVHMVVGSRTDRGSVKDVGGGRLF
jgi:hypothetical protein